MMKIQVQTIAATEYTAGEIEEFVNSMPGWMCVSFSILQYPGERRLVLYGGFMEIVKLEPDKEAAAAHDEVSALCSALLKLHRENPALLDRLMTEISGFPCVDMDKVRAFARGAP